MSSIPKEILQQYYVSTGIDLLDELIYGWPKGRIAVVYGDFKSGKTTLAMMASIRAIAEKRHVLYLDADCGVTPMRFYTLADGMVKRGLVKDFLRESIATNLHLYTATSLEEQHEIVTEYFIEKLREEDVGLVVIDSVAVYYYERVLSAPRESAVAEAQEVMSKISNELMQIQREAAKHGAPIIAISWSASKAGDMLQKFLGYRAHFLLRLFRLPGGLRHAYLIDHRDRPAGYGLMMLMTEAGLIPAPNAKVEQNYIWELLDATDEVHRWRMDPW